MNILGTGMSGLVGSRVTELLTLFASFEDLSLDTGVDITQKEIVASRIASSDAPWMFHFAAKTDVDAAEKERSLGERSPTWIVNVLATEHIVAACRKTGKHLLYISTDYVFDGTKETYNEEDAPRPQGWYALTKYEGEKSVATLGKQGLIIRIANPYRAVFAPKPDFVAKIKERLEQGDPLTSPTDQVFVPTFIDDIAWAIKALIEGNAWGIYHVVGSQALSPFEACRKIAHAFFLDDSRILPTTFVQYFAGRAPRPFRANLKNDKITKFGVRMSTFDEGLKELLKQRGK